MSEKVKATIRKFILLVNYVVVFIFCLTLVAQTQIPVLERAVFGFGAIFFGMGFRSVVRALMPLDEDNLSKK